jgi:hypothetical protein
MITLFAMCTPGHVIPTSLLWKPDDTTSNYRMLSLFIHIFIRAVWYVLYEGYTTWRSSKCLILHIKITLMLIWNSPHNTFNKQVVLKTENLDNLMWFFCNQPRNINIGLWVAENLTSGMLATTRNLSLSWATQKCSKMTKFNYMQVFG